LRDPLDPVRENAVIALGKLGDFARPTVPEIQAVVREGKINALVPSARTLWQLTRNPDIVVPVLMEDLNRPGTSPEAAAMLGELGEAAKAAVPDLAKSLHSSDLLLRLAAAGALGKIGPAARPALPDLEKILQDESDEVRQAAQEALKQIQR
ncbi:MAG: HEAT repeat domain-containing protein, partial [Pirellulales bacterium]|nr:HEAT repeat domain-containing protein [Pirellulales bacterium]